MVLRDRRGRESRRQIRVQVLEVPDDGDKSLFVFDDPRDVRGTAFLVHAHREGADDQWTLSARPETRQAHQLGEPVRVVHGQRVRVRKT